jgi:hypothetical protein
LQKNVLNYDFYRRPVFRICVLYVDVEISVQRQLARGRMIREHNIEVKKTGQGVLWDERVTDNDETVSYTYIRFIYLHPHPLLAYS